MCVEIFLSVYTINNICLDRNVFWGNQNFGIKKLAQIFGKGVVQHFLDVEVRKNAENVESVEFAGF